MVPLARIYYWRRLLTIGALASCTPFAHRAQGSTAQENEGRILASNVVLSCTKPPGGIHFSCSLDPGRDYILTLVGTLSGTPPTLRIDFGGTGSQDYFYNVLSGRKLNLRVRSSGVLNLLIYQDSSFRYALTSLTVRPAVAPSDFEINEIADPRAHHKALSLATATRSAERPDEGFNRYGGAPPLLFTSWEFICLFLPVVLLLHRLLRFGRWAIAFLVLVSFFWYSCWDWRFGPLILLSIAVNWWGGICLEKGRSRSLLTGLLVFNLIPLLYFKYVAFAFSAVGLRATDWITPALIPNVLPLGISFYTFQKVAYAVDVYRGSPPERSPVRFAFFVLFFPQLVAGPITHHSQIFPQLTNRPRNRKVMFFLGCAYFIIGFIKKRYVADELSTVVDRYFKDGVVQYADQSIVAALGYTLQLYFDFSGYSDMALGLAAMFGIRLPWNFNSPYKSSSFREFWRRWHMTLSAFLRDYIYIPLGGNRVPKWRMYVNLLITMLIGGIWHGAGWVFIIWGLGHGVLLCIEHLIGAKLWESIPSVARAGFVFSCVALLWIPFRAENLALTFQLFSGLLHWHFTAWSYAHTYCTIGLLVVFFAPNSHALVSACESACRGAVRPVWSFGGRIGWYAPIGVLASAFAITFFYSEAPDAWLRRHFQLARERDFVRTNLGTLRVNIDRCAALSGPEDKWVVVGPSYAGHLGYFHISDKSRHIEVNAGSIGIGGQAMSNWIRIAAAVLTDPTVKRIYVSCSPVGMSPPSAPQFPLPFYSEGADALASLGIEGPSRELGNLGPAKISFWDVLWDVVRLRLESEKYFQLRSLALTVFQRLPFQVAFEKSAALNPTLFSDAQLESARQRIAAIWEQAKVSPKSPPDLANGSDAKFGWAKRGIVEGLGDGQSTDKAIGRLVSLAGLHHVKVILFETPTLRDRRSIYPEGFFGSYQKALAQLAKRHHVDYLDLSGLLPDDADAMDDFCHPNIELRPLILEMLISKSNNEPKI